MKDIFGKALLDYHRQPGQQHLITWTNLTEDDPVPLAYFFRTHAQMPALEQTALEMSAGRVLDIGCGSGSHALYLQDEKKLAVTGIDQSAGAIAVAQERGVHHCIHAPILAHQNHTYDTLLLLMNGLGVAHTLNGVLPLLRHLKGLIAPSGQILVDSSDLIYLFPKNEQSTWKNQPDYYGEVDYGIAYQQEEEVFPWLYLDYARLNHWAQQAGLQCEKVMDGPHFDYLARLWH